MVVNVWMYYKSIDIELVLVWYLRKNEFRLLLMKTYLFTYYWILKCILQSWSCFKKHGLYSLIYTVWDSQQHIVCLMFVSWVDINHIFCWQKRLKVFMDFSIHHWKTLQLWKALIKLLPVLQKLHNSSSIRVPG